MREELRIHVQKRGTRNYTRWTSLFKWSIYQLNFASTELCEFANAFEALRSIGNNGNLIEIVIGRPFPVGIFIYGYRHKKERNREVEAVEKWLNKKGINPSPAACGTSAVNEMRYGRRNNGPIYPDMSSMSTAIWTQKEGVFSERKWMRQMAEGIIMY
jgi:hypothetical protein